MTPRALLTLAYALAVLVTVIAAGILGGSL